MFATLTSFFLTSPVHATLTLGMFLLTIGLMKVFFKHFVGLAVAFAMLVCLGVVDQNGSPKADSPKAAITKSIKDAIKDKIFKR